jgi:hypothetical protein
MEGWDQNLRSHTALAIVVFGLAIFPATADANGFCDTTVLHDYAKPLASMPSLPRPPVPGRLPFGPGKIRFIRTGQGPLAGDEGSLGFSLSYAPKGEGNRSPRLAWSVTARLVRVDRHGHAFRNSKPLQKRREIDHLNASSPSEFSFSAPRKAGIYRLEIDIRNEFDKRLGRFGEYVRVLSPSLVPRLTLSGDHFQAGEGMVATLENLGPDPLSFGLSRSIEYYDGSAWVAAPSFRQGFVFLIQLWLQPGEATSCWGAVIPAEAPAGQYRISLEVDRASGGPVPSAPRPLTVASEFEILPAP